MLLQRQPANVAQLHHAYEAAELLCMEAREQMETATSVHEVGHWQAVYTVERRRMKDARARWLDAMRRTAPIGTLADAREGGGL